MTFEVQNYVCRGHNQTHLLVSNGHMGYSPRSARPNGLRLKQLAGFFLAFGTQQHIRQGHIKSGRKERSDMNDRAVSKV
jgi:hypothetical protein